MSSLAREGRGGFYAKNRYNNLTIINQQIRNYEENDRQDLAPISQNKGASAPAIITKPYRITVKRKQYETRFL